jgi:hypothetical protein
MGPDAALQMIDGADRVDAVTRAARVVSRDHAQEGGLACR